MLTTVENPFLNFLASSRTMPNVLRAKCVIVGDSIAGKTSIVQTFAQDSHNFQRSYTITNGVDIRSKKVAIPDADDVVELFLYDCSGKDLYLNFVSQMLNGVSMLYVVFDVTQENSLKQCSVWLEAVKKASGQTNVPGVLVGNKTDLTKRRVISKDDAAEFARHNSLVYFESSAMENEGIEEPFFYLVNEWHKLFLEKTEMFKTLS